MDFILKRGLFKVYKEKYAITDTAGNECFFIDTDHSMLQGYVLEDFNGNPLITMKRRYWRWFNRWDIKNANGDTLFIIKRKRIPLVKKYKIVNKGDSSTSKYEIDGKVFAWDFKITRDGQIISTIKRNFGTVASTYTISIDEQKETLRCLAIALVMDACHNKRTKSFKTPILGIRF